MLALPSGFGNPRYDEIEKIHSSHIVVCTPHASIRPTASQLHSACLFLILLRRTALNLCHTTELLRPILALFACVSQSSAWRSTTLDGRLSQLTLLSASLLFLRRHAHSDESVMWLELLHRSLVFVNQCETRALASTVLRTETEHGDLVLLGLVKLG